MQRRRVLAAVGTGLGTLAGCLSGGGEPPVVDNGVDDPERNLTVAVQVLEDGEPRGETTVVLADQSGGDQAEGTTDGQGRLRFVEAVGPPPCNPIRLSLPAADGTHDVGCHNGGKTVSAELDVARL